MSKPFSVPRQIELDLLTASTSLGVDPATINFNQYRKWLASTGIKPSESFLDGMRKLGGYTTIRNSLFIEDPSREGSEAVEREQIKLKAQGKKKHALESTWQASFVKRFEEIARTHLSKKVVPSGYSKSKVADKRDLQREVNIVLSDLHIGSNLEAREVPIQFGRVEEARRLAAITDQVCSYKPQYRKESVLNVSLLGDIIQNQLHDPRDGFPLAEQAAAAIYLLRQCLVTLAANYRQVNIRVSTGNHGRWPLAHKRSGVDQKWDSIESVIYFALKEALAHLPNVTFEIPYEPYAIYQSNGNDGVFVTHGDTIISIGNPGSAINTKGLEQQINKINSYLPSKHGVAKCGLFVVGHVHFGTLLHLPNKVKLITNGPLVPSDTYGMSLGYLSNTTGQSLWESVPGHIVGDYRFLEVDETTDRDAKLDKIIHKFEGF